MKYPIIFLIIVSSSIFLGILFAILNNDIYKETLTIKNNIKPEIQPKSENNKPLTNTENSNKENNKNPLNTDNDNHQTEKNKNNIINQNDILNEDNEKDNKDKDNVEEKKNENIITDNKEKKEDIKQGPNKIHIALNLDNKYVYPCIVFLTSLLENRANTTFYIVHIMISKDINKENLQKMNSIVGKYGKHAFNITYYQMGNDFKGAITGSHISTAAYYRIALPSLLPNADKVIYTDTDIINFVDLFEMYNLEFNENSYLMGTLDNIGLLNELHKLGVYTRKYMNSGILLMNLKAMRKDGIEQKIRKYIFSHYLDHHDQTAINAVCSQNFDILSLKYATFSYKTFEDLVNWNNRQDEQYKYKDYELKQAFYSPTLLHFAGWVKPWNHDFRGSNGEYWWYYAKKSDYYLEIIKNYGFNQKDIEKILQKIPEDGGLLKRNYKK